MSKYDDKNWRGNPDGHAAMLVALQNIDAAGLHIHGEAVRSGFYEMRDETDPMHAACVAGLIASEVHEMIDTLRAPEPEVAPRIGGDFTHEEEEAADTFIRHLDYCAWRKLRLGAAVVAKLGANRRRGHRFGGKKF